MSGFCYESDGGWNSPYCLEYDGGFFCHKDFHIFCHEGCGSLNYSTIPWGDIAIAIGTLDLLQTFPFHQTHHGSAILSKEGG